MEYTWKNFERRGEGGEGGFDRHAECVNRGKRKTHILGELHISYLHFKIPAIVSSCSIFPGGRQPRKKHHPKFQKLIFQKCVQNLQNLYLELS